MAVPSYTNIQVTPEDEHEQTSAMAAVAIVVVAIFSCALASGFGILAHAVAAHALR